MSPASEYTITVEAIGSTDAADIAKRRAREDGFKVRTVSRIVALGSPSPATRGRWSVTLAVVRP